MLTGTSEQMELVGGISPVTDMSQENKFVSEGDLCL